MDIFTHAVVGAVAGGVVGHPLIGAVVGVLPDCVLGIKRQTGPNKAYRYTHSIITPLLVSALTMLYSADIAFAIFLSWFCHIFLDMPTHGNLWSPRLLYPFSNHYQRGFMEWEWFNTTWFFGLILGIILCVALLLTGLLY